MNLAEYLRWRSNGSAVKSLSRAEARLLGMPHPMRAGWSHGSHARIIDDELVGKLKDAYRSAMLRQR